MTANFCVQCGAPRTDGRVCQLCGAAYVAPVTRSASASAMAHSSASGVARRTAHSQQSGSAIRADQSSTSSTESADYGHAHQTSSSTGNNNGNNGTSSLRRAQSVPITSASGARAPPQSRTFFARRYADHPTCDVCSSTFDVAKRRHQCRKCGRFICGACSPVRLLIPWGEQLEGAKGYDKSVPQRVCLHCAPALQPVQDDLVAMYARSNAENHHEAKGRLHLPYTSSLAKECQHAADIVGNFFRDDNAAASDRSIPVALLENAQGLAVMTIVKAGFMIVGKLGTGLVLAKLEDGTWSAPSAIGTVGLGGGFEIGGEIVEVMIILGSRGAVEVFHKPQVNLGAGLDIAVGPYGRSATAAAALSTTCLNANYSYSHSKGLYAGVSLQGSVIATRSDLNRKFYGRDLEPKELLSGAVAPPMAATPLYDALFSAMHHVDAHKGAQAERAALMGACRICQCPTFAAHSLQLWNKKCKSCDHIH